MARQAMHDPCASTNLSTPRSAESCQSGPPQRKGSRGPHSTANATANLLHLVGTTLWRTDPTCIRPIDHPAHPPMPHLPLTSTPLRVLTCSATHVSLQSIWISPPPHSTHCRSIRGCTCVQVEQTQPLTTSGRTFLANFVGRDPPGTQPLREPKQARQAWLLVSRSPSVSRPLATLAPKNQRPGGRRGDGESLARSLPPEAACAQSKRAEWLRSTSPCWMGSTGTVRLFWDMLPCVFHVENGASRQEALLRGESKAL